MCTKNCISVNVDCEIKSNYNKNKHWGLYHIYTHTITFFSRRLRILDTRILLEKDEIMKDEESMTTQTICSPGHVMIDSI